jgi:hypothetical protein
VYTHNHHEKEEEIHQDVVQLEESLIERPRKACICVDKGQGKDERELPTLKRNVSMKWKR